MARPKSPPRVCGPYAERSGTRFRLRVLGNGTERNLYFKTSAEALAARSEAERALLAPATHLLRELIGAYADAKEQHGACKPQTALHERGRLRSFFAADLERDIREIDARRAEELYRVATVAVSPKTGRPLEAASHRFCLSLARRFFGWAVQKGYAADNPFKGVRPVGRTAAGKPQLRIEEAARFIATALELFDSRQDVLALGAAVALLMGMRASEVLGLQVRDVDSGGKVLWIDAGKTRNARRHLQVPSVLLPRLVRLCAGRAPAELVLGPARSGAPRHHRVLWAAVGRICARAHVPRVCTHSLRGLWATLSVESGALSDLVATSLGHGSFAMTEKHYAQPEAVRAVRTRRVLGLLNLNSNQENLGPAPAPENAETVEAERLLSQLPRGTLTKLFELARRRGELG